MLRLLRAVRLLLAALGALMVIVTCTPAVGWTVTRLAGNWTSERSGTLIVLHAGSLDNEYVGPSAYFRAVSAATYFREGRFERVIVSGKGGGPLRRFLLAYGVPPEKILLEPASTTTRENALFTARMLTGIDGPKVLVTSDYHMRRARLAFAKAGLEVLPAPAPDLLKSANNWSGRWPAFLAVLGELAKSAYYALRGWA